MKTCQVCNTDFQITKEDKVFYQRITVPAPKLCPQCRHKRRLSYRNELNLYGRTCDLCKKDIISVFPDNSNYTVYCNKCWWGDSWDPLNYGQTYNPDRPFFEQFAELEKSIPHFALFQDDNSENCQYTNYGLNNKSCYLALCVYSEDVYYSHGAIQSKSCIDIQKCMSCELCYDCIDCTNCYNVFFSKDCTNSRDSYFLEDCRGCSDCFCSAGLKNRRFVFKNQQLSEGDYRNAIKKIEFTHETIQDFKKQLREISSHIPKNYMHGLNNQNVSGDYIDNCKNLTHCFDCLHECENLSYCDFCGMKCRDCYDCSHAGVGMELCYEINGMVTANNCKFICSSRNIQNCQYCQYVYSSENLFGCIGLNRKNHCILNKQYSENEYQKLQTEIIENMKMRSEYGEFFPEHFSPFAYNESVAYEYYPLRKEQAIAKGLKWKEVTKVLKHDSKELICITCDQQFRLIQQEIDFYQKHHLPPPNQCPKCRHAARFVQRNPCQLWTRNCQKCGISFKTAYNPERSEIVYCEKCYLKEVY